jgi:hypothetical protein
MSSIPTCQLPIIAAVVLLSPAFAFLMARRRRRWRHRLVAVS